MGFLLNQRQSALDPCFIARIQSTLPFFVGLTGQWTPCQHLGFGGPWDPWVSGVRCQKPYLEVCSFFCFVVAVKNQRQSALDPCFAKDSKCSAFFIWLSFVQNGYIDKK